MPNKNHIKFFVNNYLSKNRIPLSNVSFEGNGDLEVIEIINLFDPLNVQKGIELLGYINSLLFQFHSLLYQMQVVSEEEQSTTLEKKQNITEVDLVFQKDAFEKINERMNVLFEKKA